jgi:hypothetical protein
MEYFHIRWYSPQAHSVDYHTCNRVRNMTVRLFIFINSVSLAIGNLDYHQNSTTFFERLHACSKQSWSFSSWTHMIVVSSIVGVFSKRLQLSFGNRKYDKITSEKWNVETVISINQCSTHHTHWKLLQNFCVVALVILPNCMTIDRGWKAKSCSYQHTHRYIYDNARTWFKLRLASRLKDYSRFPCFK